MDEQVNNNLVNQINMEDTVITITPTMQAMEFDEIAELFTNEGNYAKAEEYYLEEKNILEGLYRENPKDNFFDLMNFYNNMGSFYILVDKNTEAEQYFVHAFNKVQELSKQEPNAYNNELARPLENLSLLYYKLNKMDKAKEKINQAISLRESAKNKDAENSSFLAYNYKILGDISLTLNVLNEAELSYLKSLEILRIIYPANKEIFEPRLSSIYLDLADLYELKGDQEEAKRYTELANQ